jgi:hypothetical protein
VGGQRSGVRQSVRHRARRGECAACVPDCAVDADPQAAVAGARSTQLHVPVHRVQKPGQPPRSSTGSAPRNTGRIPAEDAPFLGDLVRPVAAQPRSRLRRAQSLSWVRSRAITSDSGTVCRSPSCSPRYGPMVTIVASDPISAFGAHYHDRAGRVVHGVLTDRAQQGTYESAAAVAAHNQQVRAFGLLDKHCAG